MKEDLLFNRELSILEYLYANVCACNVILVLNITGKITGPQIEDALVQLQKRHVLLRSMIVDQPDRTCFIENPDISLTLKTIERTGPEQWIQVCMEEDKKPFDYNQEVPIRFIHLSSSNESDIIILCQHAICDGMSLVSLGRDLMNIIGFPGKALEKLPPPLSMFDPSRFPANIRVNWLRKKVYEKINSKWQKEKILFDNEDRHNIEQIFWKSREYLIHPWEIQSPVLDKLTAKCHEKKVTITNLLICSAMAAHLKIPGPFPQYFPKFSVAVDMRNRFQPPIGDLLGLYASGTISKYNYSQKYSVWENASRLQRIVRKQLDDKKLLTHFKQMTLLDPTMFACIPYKGFGGDVEPHQSRYEKIHSYALQHDFMYRFIKKRYSTVGLNMNFIMTNLGKVDIPQKYGEYFLNNIRFIPPASNSAEKVMGAVTFGNTMSLNLSHYPTSYSYENMLKIKEYLMEILLEAID